MVEKIVARNYTSENKKEQDDKTFESIVGEQTYAHNSFWELVMDFVEGDYTQNPLSSVINEAMGFDVITGKDNENKEKVSLTVLTNIDENIAVIKLDDSDIIARISVIEDIETRKSMRKIAHKLGWFSNPIGSFISEYNGVKIDCTLYRDDFFYGDETAPEYVSNVYVYPVPEENKVNETLEDSNIFVGADEFASRHAKSKDEPNGLFYIESLGISENAQEEARISRLTGENVLNVLYGMHNHALTDRSMSKDEFKKLPSLVDHLDDMLINYYHKISRIISDKDKKELRSSMLHAQKLLNDLRGEPETLLLGDSLKDVAFNLSTGEMVNVKRVYRGPVILDLVYTIYYADLSYEEEGALERHLRNYRLKSRMTSEEQHGYNELYVPKYIEVLEIIDNLRERI